MPVASVPGPDVPVPAEMARVAGEPVELVWLNQAGGLTGRTAGSDGVFVKWNPPGSSESLRAEADRLAWIAGRHPTPVVLQYTTSDAGETLVTRALAGRSAVDPRWRARPDDAVRALAAGLRALHAVPPETCPFSWSVATRIAEAEQAGREVPAEYADAPPIDRLVVAHGDACAPNTLIDSRGRFLATVDLGRLGLADRWADLAVVTMSFAWNYDLFSEELFWRTYGVEPDAERIAYYRALWDAT